MNALRWIGFLMLALPLLGLSIFSLVSMVVAARTGDKDARTLLVVICTITWVMTALTLLSTGR